MLSQPTSPKISFTLLICLISHSWGISQWTQTGGPEGADSGEIVKIGSALIMSAGNGGIYKSTDDGDSWFWSSFGLPCNEGVQTLKEHNGLLYASISRSGVYFSDDAGDSWRPINTGIEGLTFYALLIDGDNLYAGNANGGVYYSPDNGVSWSNKSSGISNVQIQDFTIYNSRVYAGGRFLYESSNNGNTWQRIDVPGLGPNGVRSMTVANNIFYVAGDGNVLTSTNDLTTWNPSTINTNASNLGLDSYGNTVYFGTSSGRFYYTNDSGATWNVAQNILTSSFASHIYFSPNKIIMSTREGLFQSLDMGVSWNPNNRGLRALQIESLVDNGNFIFAGTIDQGIFRSNDNGASWTKINNGLDALNSTTVSTILPIGNNIYLGTGGGVYLSSDNGDSWTRTLDPGQNKSASVIAYNGTALATGVSGAGIFISNDMGQSWNLTATNGINIDTDYRSLIMEGDIIATSTHNGEIFISENLGNSWNNRSVPGPFASVYDLKYQNNRLYASTARGLFASYNLGATWLLVNNDSKSFQDVVIDGDNIYAATANGVYVTDSNSSQWYPVCEGLGGQYINELILKNDILFAGSFSSSVWQLPKSEAQISYLMNTSTNNNVGVTFCSNDAPIDLTSFLSTTTNGNGQWAPRLSSGSGIFDPSLDEEGIYVYTLSKGPCDCETTTSVTISITNMPSAGINNELLICPETESVNLFDTLNGDPDPGGFWTPSLASGTEVFNPAVDPLGYYAYTVQGSCGIDTSQIRITTADSFEFTDFEINISSTNSVSILIDSNWDYEYSLDGIEFQDDNVFEDLLGGEYIIYGREIDGCGYFQEEILVADYPKFFTPNGDGINDYWRITEHPDVSYILRIYNRYGKLLKQLDANSKWNGSYNNKPMPMTDYWFKLVFQDGSVQSGHFTLKR